MVGIGFKKTSNTCQELESILLRICQDELTGYWSFSWQDSTAGSSLRYVLFSKGKPVYIGKETLTGHTFVRILQRYIHKFQENAISNPDLIDNKALSTNDLDELVDASLSTGKVNLQDVLHALRLAMLEELDLIPVGEIERQVTLVSNNKLQPLEFSEYLDSLENLFIERERRSLLWCELEPSIPSMELIPTLKCDAIAQSSLSDKKKRQLENLVKGNKTLAEIAKLTSQDRLEIATTFSKLLKKGLVNLVESPDADGSNSNPEANLEIDGLTVVLVDDSPVLALEFHSLTEQLGYNVRAVLEPNQAIDLLREVQPIMAFIDINMPDLSGFELVKRIRSCPEIASIPLTILTGENKLSNKWQAKWSDCHFLMKPLTPEEVPQFRENLKAILQECAASSVTE